MLTTNMQEKAKALFEYLKELFQLNQQKVLDVQKQQGFVFLRRIENPKYVQIITRDSGTEEAGESELLIKFHKPEFTSCPAPDQTLLSWLMPGWNDYRHEAAHYAFREIERPADAAEATASSNADDNSETAEIDLFSMLEESEKENAEQQAEPTVQKILFEDDPGRVAAYEAWLTEREEWAKEQKVILDLRSAFTDLFDMYNLLRQSPDTLEFMVGNGQLTDKKNKEINHPLFLKRLKIELDAVQNTLLISDTDEPGSMYLPMFSVMEDINADIIRPLEKRAEEENVHPLDHNEGGDLLKSVAHQLHTSNRYIGPDEAFSSIEERIAVRWNPVLFLCKKPDGTIKALEAILHAIENGAEIPGSLIGLLGGILSDPADEGGSDAGNGSGEPSPASAGWVDPETLPLEDEDILLPKPANREQMQIVRRIEHSPAVLVQGPPGTGKTHTIANLLGHFLAQGKTMLVTSHTSKALTVLKEKVPEDLQALCVAMLEDNQKDMENSVNDIIERTTLTSLYQQRKNAEKIRAERHQTLLDLQEARNLVYAIRHKEFEPIVYRGDSMSPVDAAKFVSEHQAMAGLIPGTIDMDAPFPLDDNELESLYNSNQMITQQEENEIVNGLPELSDLMEPALLMRGLDIQERLSVQLDAMNADGKVHLEWKPAQYAVIDTLTDQVYARQGSDEAEQKLSSLLSLYREEIHSWAVTAIADGAENGLANKKWEQLVHLIDETYARAQTVLEDQLKRPVRIVASGYAALTPVYQELLGDAEKHGHVRKNSLLLKKEKKEALASVTINGNTPEYPQDFRNILAYFDLLSLRERLGQLWDSLMAAHGALKFSSLGDESERSCFQQKKNIEYWLKWARTTREDICRLSREAGLGDSLIQPISHYVSMTDDKAGAMLEHIRNNIAPALNLLHLVNELYAYTTRKESTLEALKRYPGSAVCRDISAAVDAESVENYELALAHLKSLLEKRDIQSHREAILKKLRNSAPDWAEAVEQRNGIHGGATVPADLRTAWKAAQLSAQVDLITNTPLTDAEQKVSQLTTQFRTLTEKYACALAWCALQQRIEENPQLRQTLNGWKQTIVKIGKGTGKRAPALRAEARKLMIECQKAVPAWIMPVATVMNSIDPETTKFDVIIIDEASQSDITAASILYMGKKIIVVGDDEQVSPLSVGLDEAKMTNLNNMLIKDKIPNAHLWDSKTSLYDIAAQVYQPLMLREHFRCVPDIIGYSNGLSYQGKIKPLREAGSSPFKTVTVSYRVNGLRNGRAKTNEEEADAITALIQACIEQPEYRNSTFGVISLLGDDQAKLISRKLSEKIPLPEYEKHRILCGNASNFQGDERDVIFLSMVDSNASDGPLAMASGEGAGANGKPMKQRYNVAVSRAKDQLWVVHSLDYTADLKPGDMRRGLLEYICNPQARGSRIQEIENESDSPFETEVATALVSQGYHIVQQWRVGAYYIDMVAIYNGARVAIECDGERWHSGEEKIREDMERQAILERLGWRFIRIRGSEYFHDRSQTISRVIQELNQKGIQPESSREVNPSEREGDPLLDRVKERAAVILSETDEPPVPSSPLIKKVPELKSVSKMPQSKPAEENPAKNETEVQSQPAIVSEPAPSAREPENHAAPQPLQIGPVNTQRPSVLREPVIPYPVKQHSPVSDGEQITMKFPIMDILSDLQAVGFDCIDNRKTSGIIWVLYDPSKSEAMKTLEKKHGFKCSLERRGALATKGKPAWRVQQINK